MTATHAQIAKTLVARAQITTPGVFERACLEVATMGTFTTLERMLPGTRFASRKVGPDEWELVGTCGDGSVCIWRVGA